MARISTKEVYAFESIEGASFTLRVVTEDLRMKVREGTLPLMEKFHTLNDEESVIEGKPAAERTPEEANRLRQIGSESSSVLISMDNLWFEEALLTINDLETEDGPVTKENFRQFAPAKAYAEVITKIRERANLGGEATKN